MKVRNAHVYLLLFVSLSVSLPATTAVGQTSESTGVETLQEDLATGLITLDEFVLFGVQALITPLAPARYVPLGVESDLAIMIFLRHWGEVSPATRSAVSALMEQAGDGGFFPLANSVDPGTLAAAAQECDIGFFGLVPVVCVYTTSHFEIRWTPIEPFAPPDADSDGDGIRDYVENVGDNLESAWTEYTNLGYQLPVDRYPLRVVIGFPFFDPFGGGLVIPDQTMFLPTSGGDQYLPRHELFHVFQWEYGGDTEDERAEWFTRPGTDWWMEATAEWAAHLASPTGIPQEDAYADQLLDFLGFPDRALHAHAFINGPSGQPQYGAFIFAEYLEERFNDADVIMEVFEGTAEVDQPGALAAIEEVVDERGSTLAEELIEFARKSYLMDFQDGDVDVWRTLLEGDDRGRTVADDLGGGRPFRQRHDVIAGDTASGDSVVEPGGRAYST